MDTAAQATFEEVRLSELRARARRREIEEDREILAMIGRWEALHRQSFYRYAAERCTSDLEHPVSETTVYDWISRRNGRRPPACLIAICCEEDEQFNRWWNERNGYEQPRKLLPTSARELAEAYEQKFRELGDVGERMIREARQDAARKELDQHQPISLMRPIAGGSKP